MRGAFFEGNSCAVYKCDVFIEYASDGSVWQTRWIGEHLIVVLSIILEMNLRYEILIYTEKYVTE